MGLRKDFLYAAMLDAPELAVYTLANRRAKDKFHKKLPKLMQHDGEIYTHLEKYYTDARQRVAADNPGMTEDLIEHEAVRLAARWLADSVNFQNPAIEHGESVWSLEASRICSQLETPARIRIQNLNSKVANLDLSGLKRFLELKGKEQIETIGDAIDLRFAFREIESLSLTEDDWINRMSPQAIRDAKSCLTEGVPLDELIGRSLAIHVFGSPNLPPEIASRLQAFRVNGMGSHLYRSMLESANTMRRPGPIASEAEMLAHWEKIAVMALGDNISCSWTQQNLLESFGVAINNEELKPFAIKYIKKQILGIDYFDFDLIDKYQISIADLQLDEEQKTKAVMGRMYDVYAAIKIATLLGVEMDWQNKFRSDAEKAIVHKLTACSDYRGGDSAHGLKSAIARLEGCLGIKIDWRRYTHLIQHLFGEIVCDGFKLEAVQHITGIEPDWSGEAGLWAKETIAHNIFSQVLDTEQIHDIENRTGLSIDLQEFVPTFVGMICANLPTQGAAIIPATMNKFRISINWSEYTVELNQAIARMIDIGMLKELEEVSRLTSQRPDYQGSLRDTVLKRYWNCLSFGGIDSSSLERLKNISGITPDWALHTDRVLAIQEKVLQSRLYDALKGIIQETGVSLPEEKIKESVYGELRDALRTGLSINVVVNNIKPLGFELDWQGELFPDLEKAYLAALDNSDLELIGKLLAATQTGLAWAEKYSDKVQAKYAKILDNDQVGDKINLIKAIAKATDCQPDWNKLREHIMNLYAKNLRIAGTVSSDVWDLQRNIDNFKQTWVEFTGIALDWKEKVILKVLMEYYLDLVTQSRDLKPFIDYTKVPPRWSVVRNNIQNSIHDNLNKGEFETCGRIIEGTRTKKHWDRAQIQSIYLGMLRRDEEPARYNVLLKLTGIALDKKEQGPKIQALYNELLMSKQDTWLAILIRAKSISGVEPDWGGELAPALSFRYVELLKTENFIDLQNLIAISKVAYGANLAEKQAYQTACGLWLASLEIASIITARSVVKLDLELEALKPQTRKAIQKAHMEESPERADIYLLQIQDLTGYAPDYQGKDRGIMLDLVRARLMEGSFDPNKLEVFFRRVQTQPDWQKELLAEVQKAYSVCIEKNNIVGYVWLKGKTQIQPDPAVVDEVMQNNFLDMIYQGSNETIAFWIRQGHRVALDTRQQRAFLKFVEDFFNFSYIGTEKVVELSQLLGKEIPWINYKDRAMIKYSLFLFNDNIADIAALERASNIPADWNSPEIVARIQQFYIQQLGSYQGDLEKIARVSATTGVAPDWRNNDAYSRYAEQAATNNRLIRVVRLASAIGSEDILRSAKLDSDKWCTFFDHADAFDRTKEIWEYISKVPWLMKAIKPSFQNGLEKSYEHLSVSQSYERMISYIRLTRIKPKPESVKAALIKCLGTSRFEEALQIARLCGYRRLVELTPEQIRNYRLYGVYTVAQILSADLLPEDHKERDYVKREMLRANPSLQVVFELHGKPGIPGLADKKEFCPWQTQLVPLMNNFHAIQNPEQDGVLYSGLVKFVERFGMNNLPYLARLTVYLEAYKNAVAESEEAGKGIAEAHHGQALAKLQEFWSARGSAKSINDIKTAEDVEAVFAELQEAIQHTMRCILTDEIPRGLENSPLDMELFNAIVPESSSFKRYYPRTSLIAIARRTTETRPHVMPPHYKTRVYEVALQQKRQVKLSEQDLEKEQVMSEEDKEKMRLGKETEQILGREPYKEYLSSYEDAITSHHDLGDRLDDPEYGLFSAECANLKSQIHKYEKELASIPSHEELDKKLSSGVIDDKAKKKTLAKQSSIQSALANTKKMHDKYQACQSLEGLRTILSDAIARHSGYALEIDRLSMEMDGLAEDLKNEDLDIETEEKIKDRKKMVYAQRNAVKTMQSNLGSEMEMAKALLEGLSNDKPDPYLLTQARLFALCAPGQLGKKDSLRYSSPTLRKLAIKLISLEAPGTINLLTEAADKSPMEKFRAWSDFVSNLLLQHSLKPGLDQNIPARKLPFSPETFDLLQSIWRFNGVQEKCQEALGGKADKPVAHPLVQTMVDMGKIDKRLADIDRGVLGDGNTMSLGFYPSHGLGRVFSGDIGDACYNSLAEIIARGEFPTLQGIILAQENSEEKQVRLLGSDIMFDSETISGKKALVMRAVNPTDAYIQREVRTESVLDATLDYLIATAQEGGYDQALLVLGKGRGGSGSNRQLMYDAMVARQKSHGWPIAEPLKPIAENSRFNYYNVSDTQDERVYRIWTKK